MIPFPTDKLRARTGSLTVLGDDVSITVPLDPFNLSTRPGAEQIDVDTSLRLDFIQLPSTELSALCGKTFAYPRNPEPGYIDGSIYIEHAHHPADVTEIRFGTITPEGLEATFDIELCVEFEGLGNLADAHWVCVTHLTRG